MNALKRQVKATLIIGFATLLDSMRNRILLVSLVFAIGLVAISVAAASVSIFERSRLIVDLGLATASAMGSMIAIALTILSFAGEITQRTAHTWLVRPLDRRSFVLGKYLGVVAAMVMVVTLMYLATGATIALYGETIPKALWPSIWLGGVELAVVCSVAIVFATMASPMMASIYTGCVIIAGNLSTDIALLGAHFKGAGNPVASWLLRIVYYIIPDLHLFSLRSQAANHLDVPIGFVTAGTLYGAFYSATALVLAMWIFLQRKKI